MTAMKKKWAESLAVPVTSENDLYDEAFGPPPPKKWTAHDSDASWLDPTAEKGISRALGEE